MVLVAGGTRDYPALVVVSVLNPSLVVLDAALWLFVMAGQQPKPAAGAARPRAMGVVIPRHQRLPLGPTWGTRVQPRAGRDRR